MSTTARKARKRAGIPFTRNAQPVLAAAFRDPMAKAAPRHRRRRMDRLELRRLFQTPEHRIRPTTLARLGLDAIPARTAREWFADAAPRLYRLIRGKDGTVTRVRTDYQHRIDRDDRGRAVLR